MLDRIPLIVFVALTGLAGCATLPDGSRWGDHADFTPGWQRVGEAAVTAVTSPSVWIPLAGTAVMQIDHWDQHMSDWAIDHTPLFGSPTSADDASDALEAVACAGFAASVLGTPGGEGGADWVFAKAKGGLVGASAIAATGLTSAGLQAAFSRERPNGTGDDSFPSDHASTAAVCDRLASRNLDAIPMNNVMRTALQIGTEGVTIATGWARVEAGAHYPSDVLFGMALGNFFGIMFDDAFMGDSESPRLALSIAPGPDGGEVMWDLRF